MVQDDNRILAVATLVLAAGFLLRFLPGGRGRVEGESEEELEDDDVDSATEPDGDEGSDDVESTSSSR